MRGCNDGPNDALITRITCSHSTLHNTQGNETSMLEHLLSLLDCVFGRCSPAPRTGILDVLLASCARGKKTIQEVEEARMIRTNDALMMITPLLGQCMTEGTLFDTLTEGKEHAITGDKVVNHTSLLSDKTNCKII